MDGDSMGKHRLRTSPRESGAEDLVLPIFVSWNGTLQSANVRQHQLVEEIKEFLMCGEEVPAGHMHLVYNGRLVDPGMRAADLDLREGCVLHLVLNESPFRGRKLYVRDLGNQGVVRSVSCSQDFTIRELKEEIACLPDSPAVDQQRIAFAGRELEDDYTLREYNIQKPSVLLLLRNETSSRDLSSFLSCTSPESEELSVPLDSVIRMQFSSIEQDEFQFWGQMLGSPDIRSLTAKEFELRRWGSSSDIPGEFDYDEEARVVTFIPEQPLQEASHYTVCVNKARARNESYFFDPDAGLNPSYPTSPGGILHSKVHEPVEGCVTWDFYTVGYVPLRVTSIYPRPHSTVQVHSTEISGEQAEEEGSAHGVTAVGVRKTTVPVVISFSGPLSLNESVRSWVTIPGYELLEPVYDPASYSLIYEIGSPLRGGECIRVHVNTGLVQGSRDESLKPLQQDGLFRTVSFTWKFYTSDRSIYHNANLKASGLENVVRRWENGKINATQRGRKRGTDVKLANRSTAMEAAIQAGLTSSQAAAAAGYSSEQTREPARVSAGRQIQSSAQSSKQASSRIYQADANVTDVEDPMGSSRPQRPVSSSEGMLESLQSTLSDLFQVKLFS